MLIPLLALIALAVPAGAVLADEPEPPTVATPQPLAINDTNAQQFAALVLRFRGGRLLLGNRRAQAQNIEVVCRHPDNVARFLCVARLDLSVRSRSGYDRDRFSRHSVKRDDNDHNHPRPRPQDREQQRFSCVAALRIAQQPGPNLTVLARDCVRVNPTNQGPGY